MLFRSTAPDSLPASHLPTVPDSLPASHLPTAPDSLPASHFPTAPGSLPASHLPADSDSLPESPPPTVYEVLSQKDNGCSQFVTWKNRNMDAAKPSERVKRNEKAVLDGETQILPFKTMYFSLEKENGHIQCVIGNHVFCNQT